MEVFLKQNQFTITYGYAKNSVSTVLSRLSALGLCSGVVQFYPIYSNSILAPASSVIRFNCKYLKKKKKLFSAAAFSVAALISLFFVVVDEHFGPWAPPHSGRIRDALGTQWGRIGDALGMHLGRIWDVLVIHWGTHLGHFGDAMGMQSEYIGMHLGYNLRALRRVIDWKAFQTCLKQV